MFERKKDVHESISRRGVEADRQRRRARRQGAVHALSVVWEKEGNSSSRRGSNV